MVAVVKHRLVAWIAAIGLASAAGAQRDAARADYRAGRFEAARAAFAAELAEHGAEPPPELRFDLALAALRVQRTAEAESVCRPLLQHAEAVWRARAEFVLGLAAWQRSDRAAAAAQLPDPEPMAWDLAVRATEAAFAHWCRAALLQSDDPAARRNAERAQIRLREQQQARDQAARERASKREPEPPPPAPAAGGTTETVTPQLAQQPLTDAEVQRLRERLQSLERDKRRLRQAEQRHTVEVGERDW